MPNIPSNRIAPVPQHPAVGQPEPVRSAAAAPSAKPLVRPQVVAPPQVGKPISTMSVQLLPPVAARSASRSPAFPAFDEVLKAAQDFKSGSTVSMLAARGDNARVSALCRQLASQPVGPAFLHSALQRSAKLCADHAITPRHFTRIMTALVAAADRGNMRPATAAGFVRTLAALPETSTSHEIQSLALKSLAGALRNGATRNVAASALVEMLAGRSPNLAKRMFDEFVAQLPSLPNAQRDVVARSKGSLDSLGELPRIRSDARQLATELARKPPEALVAYLRAESTDTPEAERPRLLHLARALGEELGKTEHGLDAKVMKRAAAKATPELRQLLAVVSDGAAAMDAVRAAEPNRESIKQFVREGRFDHAFQMVVRAVGRGDEELARELLVMTLSSRSSHGLARKGESEPLARATAFFNHIQQEKAHDAGRSGSSRVQFVQLEALHRYVEAQVLLQLNPDQLY